MLDRKIFVFGLIIIFVLSASYLTANIHQAVQKGDLEKVKTLLEKDPALAKAKGEEGVTPLHFAAYLGHMEIVKLLVSKKADVNAKEETRGWIPLHLACLRGDKDIAEFLIEKGADINNKSNKGRTPLHLAAQGGHKNAVEFLLTHQAAINIPDNDGLTPLHVAANEGKKDVTEFMVDKGADINVQSFTGDTPLHGAVYRGYKDVVEFLINRKAQLNMKNNNGQTALDIASRMGNKDMVELLVSRGAEGKVHIQHQTNKISDKDKTMKGLKTPLKFTILYDNYVHQEGTKADWGFSCLIEGPEKTILFDTGTQSEILFHNIDKLNFDIKKINQVVISHDHYDHTGGLSALLDVNHDVSVYLPISFPYEFVRNVENKQAEVISVNEPIKLCQNVFSTGEMGDQKKEQSLIINHPKGLIIVTGCSHQGIVNILKQAKKLFNKPIFLVFGGFHLGGKPDEELEEIVRSFKEIGVQKCGATHCTGEKAIALFKKAFGENFLTMGTGKILEISN